MIRFLLAFFSFVFLSVLSACSYSDNTESFSVTEEQKLSFSDQINKQLKLNLWNYSETDISYEQGFVPDEKNEKYQEIFDASNKMGFDFSDFAGENAVVASVELLHFNNDSAGLAYFYFVDSNIVCEYYSNNFGIFSFSEVNTFLSNKKPSNFENNDIKPDFDEKNFNIDFDDFYDIFPDKKFIATIKDGSVYIYKYNDKKGFSVYKVIDYREMGLFPVDLSFDEKGKFAVLYGKSEDDVLNEENIPEDYIDYDGYDDIEIGDTESAASNIIGVENEHMEENLNTIKITLFNSDFQPQGIEIPLNLSTYTSIDYKNDTILAARGKSVDVFKKQDGSFIKQNQIVFKQWIAKLKIYDLDKDGKNEAIVTDGVNLFVYRFDDNAELLWSTHLSMRSMYNIFYVADLNGDGIDEIYVEDTSLNTTIKYTLALFGFDVSAVEYGFEYSVGDFNGDGKADYISKNTITSEKKLFIAK